MEAQAKPVLRSWRKPRNAVVSRSGKRHGIGSSRAPASWFGPVKLILDIHHRYKGGSEVIWDSSQCLADRSTAKPWELGSCLRRAGGGRPDLGAHVTMPASRHSMVAAQLSSSCVRAGCG